MWGSEGRALISFALEIIIQSVTRFPIQPLYFPEEFSGTYLEEFWRDSEVISTGWPREKKNSTLPSIKPDCTAPKLQSLH